jgi:O-antigen/teichoic acid export membrane protein
VTTFNILPGFRKKWEAFFTGGRLATYPGEGETDVILHGRVPRDQRSRADPLKTDHLIADLKGRSVRGGLATVAGQAAQFVLQMSSAIALARLLTPADFGLVAMVTSVSALARVVADGGLSWATIQRDEINHDQVSTLFWVNVVIGLLLMLLVVALGPVLAWFYGDPRLTRIAIVASLTFPLGGLMAQHDALLKRQMRYKSVAIRDVVSYAVGVSAGLAFAWRGASYWALLALTLGTNITQVIFSWILLPWVPSWPTGRTPVLSLLTFGRNLVGYNFMSQLTRSADSILIGWVWGPNSLGLYSRAYNLMMLPWRQINAPLDGVAVSSLSRINDPEHYARYYLRTVNLMMWMSAPLIGILFVGSRPIVRLILGEQWVDAAVVFRVLAISAMFQPLYYTVTWLFISRARTDLLLKLGLFTSPLIVSSFLIGVPFGIIGVALSYSICLLLSLPFIFKVAFKGTTLTLHRLGKALLYPLVVCLVAAFVATAALALGHSENVLPQVVAIVSSFAAVYACATMATPVRMELLSIARLLKELRLRRAAALP